MPSSLTEFVPKQFLVVWLFTEAIMTCLFVAVLIWTAVEHSSELVPLIIYGLHYGATAIAFLILEDIERRLHRSGDGKSTLSMHTTELRQYSWLLLLIAILLTDVFSLVNEVLNGPTHPLTLRVLILVLWSYGVLSSLIYFVFAAVYQHIKFKPNK